MNAAQTLAAATQLGIRLTIRADNLRVRAPSRPPEHVRSALQENKAEIIALLRYSTDQWSTEDWRAFFDGRAAILEFDHGLSRPEAEATAFKACVTEWLNRNRAEAHPDQCAGCGSGETPADPLVPFGTNSTGHSWLHSQCWSDWHRSRQIEAIDALGEMDIGYEDAREQPA